MASHCLMVPPFASYLAGEEVDISVRSWIWAVLRRVYPSAQVQCLEIVNVGLLDRPFDEVLVHFRSALAFIEAAGEDVNRSVCANLKRVALLRGKGERISVTERKYGTSLVGHEGRNPFYLACRLLWVAAFVGASRPPESLDEAAARERAYEATADFAARFPEGEEWIRYIERERLRTR